MPPLEGARLMQALVIRKALELYERTGIIPNSSYTRKNMLRTTSTITGKKYAQSSQGVRLAITDLSSLLPPRTEEKS